VNDQLLFGQINLAMNNPLLTLCFSVGGLMVMLGVLVAIAASIIQLPKRVERHAINLATLGSAIGVPAVVPLMFSGLEVYSVPALKAMLICLPIVAFVCCVFNARSIESEYRESIKNLK